LGRYKSRQFLKLIENAKVIDKFDADLFFRIVDRFKVSDEKRIVVNLVNGTEIEVEIE